MIMIIPSRELRLGSWRQLLEEILILSGDAGQEGLSGQAF
jgi:hypothetical protein